MKIEKYKGNRKNLIELFLLADPDIKVLEEYLDLGQVFTLSLDGKIISAGLVSEVENDLCELKNMASLENYQGKGYGGQLLEYIFDYYKSYYKEILVGTGNSSLKNISFYKNHGFKYYKTIENFFIENYSQPIYEDGLICKDMIYFKKEL